MLSMMGLSDLAGLLRQCLCLIGFSFLGVFLLLSRMSLKLMFRNDSRPWRDHGLGVLLANVPSIENFAFYPVGQSEFNRAVLDRRLEFPLLCVNC